MRIFVVAAIASAALAAGCSSPCQELGDHLCQCRANGVTKASCEDAVRSDVERLHPGTNSNHACEDVLGTCHAPAEDQSIEFCDWIEGRCGKAACGMSQESITVLQSTAETTSTSSTTANTVGAGGTLLLTVQTGLGYVVGQAVIVTDNTSDSMTGTVSSYDPSSGDLAVSVTSSTGAGTSSSNWTIDSVTITSVTSASSSATSVGTGSTLDLMTQAGLGYVAGQAVSVADANGDSMAGTVSSYDSSTGALDVSVTSSTGAGETSSAWAIDAAAMICPK